ncbi:ATP-dependent helicase [Agrobacterium sp. FDAARGOS_525]|uniref:DEAD/DEAH box helicase n=2 Tax=Pseudomonadota TaxID=1224 RepID=UPI000F68C3AF|nr:DEAD/DEAH box helicase family protein [Agrobacterium sp. FDAARGOS_525]RSC31229.1 ATP-dependent helicase [Agrobacterium sp. FDAARGOS_525]
MDLFSSPAFVDEARAKEIVLRGYQVDAVNQLRRSAATGARRLILAAPTGSGKTEIGAHMIQLNQKKLSTAWFIVDRVTLVDQTSQRFFSYGIDHGIIQGGNRLTDYSKPVQIVSAQTLARRSIRKLPDLIIVDEAHCEYQSVLDLIEEAGSARVVGLTATPFTSGMADHWDGIVNVTTVNKLIGEGYLVPLKIKACVSPDMKGAKKKFNGEYEEEEAGQRGITIVGDVVHTWISQTRAMFGGPVKTIVFSPSVAHGAELCRQFADAGFNFQQISYLDKSDTDRDAKIREFRKPDSSIDGLVSCAVLTKGFDVPDVLCGISCRPYAKSFSSHIQEMGRVMRSSPDTGKTFGLWLDHSGNCISFADDTAWLYEYGVDSLSDAQKKDSEPREPTEKAKKKHFCGQCGMQIEPMAVSCAACGWERPNSNTIQVVQGELIDFEVSAKTSFQPRKGLRAECLSDPKSIWNAALAYCMSNTRKGEDAARKWAYGIWAGIYPSSKLPYGLFDVACRPNDVAPDAWNLIDREVRRFRKGSKSSRSAA